MNELLNWTGHPLADVGVATLCAMVGKDDPKELTLEDLDECGRELGGYYSDALFMSYLTCVFPNSPYVNPTIGADKKVAAMQRLLSPHRSAPDEGCGELRCSFSGRKASHLLDRSQIPMVTGAGILNFFPEGRSELAVSAPFLLAIQALPLGGRRTEGKLMIVHCESPEWTMWFADTYLTQNRRLIDMAQANQLPEIDGVAIDRECSGWDKAKKRSKFPDAKAPLSLVMDDLGLVVDKRFGGSMEDESVSVTVYLMSNSGQGPSLAMEHIPGQFVSFLYSLRSSQHLNSWKQHVHRSWQVAKGGGEESDEGEKRGKSTKSKQSGGRRGPGLSRNDLFNDLFSIFTNGYCDWYAAAAFIRRHLLCNPAKYYSNQAWNSGQSPRIERDDIQLIDWSLTALFLEKVLGMNEQKTELIRSFSDQLAELIFEHNDAPLFKSLVYTSREWEYRGILTKVQRRYASERKRLLLTFDQYIDLFLAMDAGDKTPWSLIRDLISIRLVEQLFAKGFFDKQGNSELLKTQEEPAEASA